MKRVLLIMGILAPLLLLMFEPAAQAQSRFLANDLLPPVPVPPDNPQTDAKIRLGMQLYFDTRLSADNTISCATCHAPDTGWANHGATDTGIKGQVGGRNSGTIIDAAYMRFQFWDGRAGSLEGQALGPIHNPIEMGETLENVVRKLNAIPGYKAQFQEVFGTEVTTDGIAKAIAAFERTIISGPSPYDRYLMGEKSALSLAKGEQDEKSITELEKSASAERGMKLFNGKAHCSACHSGPTFSDQRFHNLGVGYSAGKYADVGRYTVTQETQDMGSFKTPGLRNVAQTYPYLHDGTEKTMEDVIKLYDRGGVPNPHLDPLMLPLKLTAREKADLAEFLENLSGEFPVMQPPKLPQ